MELAERLQELRADRRHGASFLARRAAEALVEVAEAPAATSEELLERVLGAAQPRRPCAKLSCIRGRSGSSAPSPTRSRRAGPSPPSSAPAASPSSWWKTRTRRRNSRASLLLVGADTVFRDGTFCNKIGTRMLAEAAAEREVPTIVACEVIKLAPIESTTAPELAREERELFDLTPPALVHAVVTEEGTVRSDEVHAWLTAPLSCARATRC